MEGEVIEYVCLYKYVYLILSTFMCKFARKYGKVFEEKESI